MQMIVRHLLFENADNLNSSIFRFSLWIDAAFQRPVEDVIGDLEAQEHRRAIKSHVPLDGIPFYSQLKYVVVGRDAGTWPCPCGTTIVTTPISPTTASIKPGKGQTVRSFVVPKTFASSGDTG